MAEWLRPGLWELLTIKLRGIEPGQVLITKKTIGWADGVKITSRRYYGGRKPNFGVRMAEWLRPGLWELLTIKLRGIEPGQVLITKSPQGRDGAKVTSPCNCGRREPNFGVRMAEWLRPGLWELLTIKLRGIEPGQILITKSPQGRVVPKSRPLVTVAGVSQIWGSGWPSG